MRRRPREVDENGMPARLLRFHAADWPLGCHPECSFWQARSEWLAEHPVDLDDPGRPGLIVVDGPDVPFHDGEV